jgi:hypothetical protein
LRYEIGSADFLWRAKHSKFGAYARFAQSRRGHIVLQHHGTTVWFRDLHIVRR